MSDLPQISEAEFEVMKIVWKSAPINTNEITGQLSETEICNLWIEGVKFSVSMGKIFFDKNQICIIVLSKFLVFCCRIIYLIIVLPIRLRLYMNFKIFCSTNNGISNPFSWALPTPGLGNKLGFSGNTINAEGIR